MKSLDISFRTQSLGILAGIINFCWRNWREWNQSFVWYLKVHYNYDNGSITTIMAVEDRYKARRTQDNPQYKKELCRYAEHQGTSRYLSTNLTSAFHSEKIAVP